MRKMEQKNRILIVEDDTDINNLLYTALQKAGYETVQAFSGTEARDAVPDGQGGLFFDSIGSDASGNFGRRGACPNSETGQYACY